MKKNNLIFLSIILFGTIALGVIGLCIGLSVKKSDGKPSGSVVVMPREDIVSDNDGNKLNDGEIHSLPQGMLFAPMVLSDSENAEMTVEVKASITPDDAANKAVDWSVAFVNASSSWANGKTVTDYVTVTPDSDGSLIASITCKQAFGEQIKLIVTSRENPNATASCTLDYKQQFLEYAYSLTQTGKTPVINNATKKGTVYADFETEEALKLMVTYEKSAIYTVALNDSEITSPSTLTVTYKSSLETALNNAKSNLGNAVNELIGGDMAFNLANFLNKNFVKDLTSAEKNSVIKAVTDNKSSGVVFTIKDGLERVLNTFTLDIDVTALTGQKSVEGISLDNEQITFGVKTYKIIYLCAEDGDALFEVGSEYGLSKQKDGNYPETYTQGSAVSISNLKSSFFCGGIYHSGSGVNGTGHYLFEGWFLDKATTKPFNGTIPAGTTGDITLYAKITSTGTHNY